MHSSHPNNPFPFNSLTNRQFVDSSFFSLLLVWCHSSRLYGEWNRRNGLGLVEMSEVGFDLNGFLCDRVRGIWIGWNWELFVIACLKKEEWIGLVLYIPVYCYDWRWAMIMSCWVRFACYSLFRAVMVSSDWFQPWSVCLWSDSSDDCFCEFIPRLFIPLQEWETSEEFLSHPHTVNSNPTHPSFPPHSPSLFKQLQSQRILTSKGSPFLSLQQLILQRQLHLLDSLVRSLEMIGEWILHLPFEVTLIPSKSFVQSFLPHLSSTDESHHPSPDCPHQSFDWIADTVEQSTPSSFSQFTGIVSSCRFAVVNRWRRNAV